MFTQRRQKNYQSGEDANKLEQISLKFAEELRKEVKQIKFPVMFSKGLFHENIIKANNKELSRLGYFM